MSDTDRSARPRQLTMAGGFVVGGSIFLVLSVFDTITSLHSVEMREEVTKVLASPTGSGLGLSVSEALSVMRVGLMVAGACAAAAAVLGVYVFQRNRAARLALSILAVPILLTAPLTGGLVGALVAAATLMLWSGPARDWFAGRPVRQPVAASRQSGSGPGSSSGPAPWETTMPPPVARNHGHEQDPVPPSADAPVDDAPADAVNPPASSLSTAAHSSQPGAMSGYGERTPDLVMGQEPAWLPAPYTDMVRGLGPPLTVKIACVLTWVFSGVVALLYIATLAALVVAPDRIVDFVVKIPEWKDANLDRSMVLPVLWAGCLMFLAWSLGACVLAFFTWRRHNWARWLLVASSAAALVAALFTFPVGILHQLAAALAIGGLVGTAARSWFAGKSRPPGPPYSGAPGWPPAPGQYPSNPPPPGNDQGHDQGHGQPPPGGKPPVW